MKLIHFILIGFFSIPAILAYLFAIINRRKIARGNFKIIKLEGYKKVDLDSLWEIFSSSVAGLLLYLAFHDIYLFLIIVLQGFLISPISLFSQRNCMLVSPEGIKTGFGCRLIRWEKISEIVPDWSGSYEYKISHDKIEEPVTFDDDVNRETFLQKIKQFRSDLYSPWLLPENQ